MGKIIKNGISYGGSNGVIDNLTSTDATKSLSAKQGKVLNDKLTSLPTGILTAGQTTLTISDASITANGLIDVYTSVYGVNPKTVVATNGSVTLTFSAQSSNVTVKVRCL